MSEEIKKDCTYYYGELDKTYFKFEREYSKLTKQKELKFSDISPLEDLVYKAMDLKTYSLQYAQENRNGKAPDVISNQPIYQKTIKAMERKIESLDYKIKTYK